MWMRIEMEREACMSKDWLANDVCESVATRLTRCRRIEHIICGNMSFEGCPDELKSLYIEDGFLLESLEPLSACKELGTLVRMGSRTFPLCHLASRLNVTDLSPLSRKTLSLTSWWRGCQT